MKIPNLFLPKKQRYNDSCLMDTILNSNRSVNELKQWNACKQYLQVTFLSDITTIDEKFLLPGVTDGTNDNIPKSKLEWPNQNSSDKKTWKLWSQTITSIYCISKHSTTIRRDCILEHWTTKHMERLRLHSLYFSPSLDEIFEASTYGFHQYFANKIKTRQYNINIASKQTTENILTDCLPAIKTGNKFCISISHAIP